ncbi:MAG: FeoB-associated Cys-rich membrane protein [Cetobacterium sp.]|nr:FeoB-associated Cys-rich membrane protein [Cetobacterium sp. 2A]MBC2856524.1 FeoB-associated Cys-rich membrane protein [Cetobacterium sp. 2A]
MKTIFLITIVAVIAYFSLKSVIKMFKGESGCSCGSDKNKCSFKDKCHK